jgi:hypothetical protein
MIKQEGFGNLTACSRRHARLKARTYVCASTARVPVFGSKYELVRLESLVRFDEVLHER